MPSSLDLLARVANSPQQTKQLSSSPDRPLRPGTLPSVVCLLRASSFGLHGTLTSLRVLDLLLLLLSLRQLHTLGAKLGKELADTLLIDLVLGVLACAEQLGEPSAGLEQDQVSKCTGACPVGVGLGLQAAPLIQAYPKGLLSSEVGVARPGEKTGGVESTVQLLTRVFLIGWYLGGFLVCTLGFVVVPLRLVGEELENNDGDHGTAEQGVVRCDVVALETIREK